MKHLRIEPYTKDAEQRVIELWIACNLTRSWNDPIRDIQRKLDDSPDLFYLAWIKDLLVGTCMAGYDGHRGSIYYLGVAPQFQGKGVATKLIEYGEKQLTKIGCPKINLMVRKTNATVIEFYENAGYNDDPVMVLSKRLINDGQ